MPRPTLFALAALLPLLPGCGHVDYDTAPRGEFTGSLFVMWVGEGGPMGSGKFVYVPNPRDPLTFHRTNPDATVSEITPAMMYTDGGSIPKLGQVFNGFSPWGYAPAYMVHDWLFVARHCLTDNTPAPGEEVIAGMEFQESADIVAEAIQTLVQEGKVARNDVAGKTISSVVAGPFSYARWTVEGACVEDRVSPEDEAAALAGISRSTRSLRNLSRVLPDGTEKGVEPAVVVSEISF